MRPTLRRWLLVSACVVGAASLLTAVAAEGTFTIDDSNYLATVVALRSGSVSLPGTEGLPPSAEWYAFDPYPPSRGPPRMPVMPTAPPLWAPFAVPFAAFGLAGLIFLNALCFCVTAVVVHRICALHSKGGWPPYFAAALFVFGSFSLEYALGIWPHMFSVMVVTLAFGTAALTRARGGVRWAFTAGLLAAIAAGVRYQNIAVVGALGLGMLLIGERRLRSAALFAAGAAGPLLISAVINFQRLGLFNPVTKGKGYGAAAVALQGASTSRFVDLYLSFWSRVVDFSVHPPIASPGGAGPAWTADPDLGVFVALGAVKKALLQSSPWVVLAWALMLLAWRTSQPRVGEIREARAQSLVTAAVLAVFTLAGTGSTDGLCFNARYLLELMPGAAIVIGWWAERSGTSRTWWLVGGLGGALLAGLAGVGDPYSLIRTELIRWAPLLLAVLLLGAFAFALRRSRFELVNALLSACLVWALGVHLLDDLPPAQRLRHENAARLNDVRQVLPDHCALFVYSIERDALWPVWALDDCLVVDLGKDGGRDGPMVARALLQHGRRVFVDEAVPPNLIQWMVEGAQLERRPAGAKISELVGR